MTHLRSVHSFSHRGSASGDASVLPRSNHCTEGQVKTKEVETTDMTLDDSLVTMTKDAADLYTEGTYLLSSLDAGVSEDLEMAGRSSPVGKITMHLAEQKSHDVLQEISLLMGESPGPVLLQQLDASTADAIVETASTSLIGKMAMSFADKEDDVVDDMSSLMQKVELLTHLDPGKADKILESGRDSPIDELAINIANKDSSAEVMDDMSDLLEQGVELLKQLDESIASEMVDEDCNSPIGNLAMKMARQDTDNEDDLMKAVRQGSDPQQIIDATKDTIAQVGKSTDKFGQRRTRAPQGQGVFRRVTSAGMGTNTENTMSGEGEEPDSELRTPSPPFYRTPSDSFGVDLRRSCRRDGGLTEEEMRMFLMAESPVFSEEGEMQTDTEAQQPITQAHTEEQRILSLPERKDQIQQQQQTHLRSVHSLSRWSSASGNASVLATSDHCTEGQVQAEDVETTDMTLDDSLVTMTKDAADLYTEGTYLLSSLDAGVSEDLEMAGRSSPVGKMMMHLAKQKNYDVLQEMPCLMGESSVLLQQLDVATADAIVETASTSLIGKMAMSMVDKKEDDVVDDMSSLMQVGAKVVQRQDLELESESANLLHDTISSSISSSARLPSKQVLQDIQGGCSTSALNLESLAQNMVDYTLQDLIKERKQISEKLNAAVSMFVQQFLLQASADVRRLEAEEECFRVVENEIQAVEWVAAAELATAAADADVAAMMLAAAQATLVAHSALALEAAGQAAVDAAIISAQNSLQASDNERKNHQLHIAAGIAKDAVYAVAMTEVAGPANLVLWTDIKQENAKAEEIEMKVAEAVDNVKGVNMSAAVMQAFKEEEERVRQLFRAARKKLEMKNQREAAIECRTLDKERLQQEGPPPSLPTRYGEVVNLSLIDIAVITP